MILKASGVDRILLVYLFYFVLAALLIWLLEPGIPSIGDSLWYCFAVATTVGFGDFAAATLAGRIVTVLLSVYSIVVVAIFTAVITGYIMDTIKARADESAAQFLDDLEHLPELSPEELSDLSQKVKEYRQKKHGD